MAAQVDACVREFECEFAKPGVRWMSVDYSELLRDPGLVIARVCDALRPFGSTMAPLEVMLPTLDPPASTALRADLDAEVRAVFSSGRGR